MATDGNPQVETPRHGMALWAAVMGAPMIWSVQMGANYALAPWSCPNRQIVLHLITLGGLVLVVVGAVLSWRQWKVAGGGSPEEDVGGVVARQQFLGALGLLTCLLFGVLIVAQGIPSFFFNGCWN